MRRCLVPSVLALTLLLLLLTARPSFAQPQKFSQRLEPGQILFYQIDVSSSRNVKSESRIISPQAPPTAQLSISALLQVEVLASGRSGLHLKTYLSERAASTPTQSSAGDKVVEVAISSNGSASQISGFENLSASQQSAWTAWLSRFTAAMNFPRGSARSGQKWQSVEPETAPSPIAGLSWNKRFEHVRDEPCTESAQKRESPVQPVAALNHCAVILIRETLRQKSSPQKATPEDYKLQNLTTRGTATGQNETILYISLSTGLLVRSTEQAQQSMDVSVALADGSNQVHYEIAAKSRSEIRLLPDAPH